MKLTVLYHSETGNTKKVAEIVAEGAREVADIEVKCMSVEDIDCDFLNKSKCVIFGSPTYYANFSWKLKKWFDKSKNCKLGGKLGAVFATENFLGGGADFSLLTLIGHMLVKGMLVYSGGSAEGHPYTHFGAVCIKGGNDKQLERAKIFGHRVAAKALEIFHD